MILVIVPYPVVIFSEGVHEVLARETTYVVSNAAILPSISLEFVRGENMVHTLDMQKQKKPVILHYGDDSESLDVIILAKDTLRCLSSTNSMLPLGDMRLLYGDLIEVEKIEHNAYRLVNIPSDQEYIHHFYNFGTFGPTRSASRNKESRDAARKKLHNDMRDQLTPQRYTDYLHAIGGEWERDHFFFITLTVHIPRVRIKEYKKMLPELSPALAKQNEIAITSGEFDPDEL